MYDKQGSFRTRWSSDTVPFTADGPTSNLKKLISKEFMKPLVALPCPSPFSPLLARLNPKFKTESYNVKSP